MSTPTASPFGQAHELWNTERDGACLVAQLKDDALHCVPADSSYDLGHLFGNAACDQPVGDAVCRTIPPAYVVRRAPAAEGAACPLDSSIPRIDRVSERGPAVPEGSLYSRPAGGSRCSLHEPRPGIRYYSVGAEVPPSTFAGIVLKTE